MRANPHLRDFPCVLTFLATLRAYRPDVIDQLRTNRIPVETVMSWISSVQNPQFRIHAEASLLVEFSDGQNGKRVIEYGHLVTSSPIPGGMEKAANYARAVMAAMDSFRQWNPNVTSGVISLLTLSIRF